MAAATVATGGAAGVAGGVLGTELSAFAALEHLAHDSELLSAVVEASRPLKDLHDKKGEFDDARDIAAKTEDAIKIYKRNMKAGRR